MHGRPRSGARATVRTPLPALAVQWIAPPLTTVRQPPTNMAGMAVRLLVQLINGEQPETLRVEPATRLIVRESTAPVVSS
ncbi:substrate-binding domain-containing protein [Nonomuraea sp. B19D2]|uniref:substrate-binding domain-containing protein n=1 Tax=Nonomuraea sp. B19D2 TaxID=3159561 RepID=UPI0032DADA30